MKISLLIFVILTIGMNSFACVNSDTRILSDGTPVYQHIPTTEVFRLAFYPKNYDKAYRQLDSLYKLTKNIDFLSDNGVILILQGKYREAIHFYLEIEKMQPDRYSTASNLGTAYELYGQAENALKWIKKAYELNPSSHKDSEWLHVRILEAKTKGDAYITDKFLINTSFGLDKEPFSELKDSDLLSLEYTLVYQLSERISFVEPKDKIIGRLFFELANIYYVKGQFEKAIDSYKQAKLYGYEGSLLKLRIETALEDMNQLNKKIQAKEILYWSLGFLTIVGLITYLVSKKSFRHKLFS